MKFEIITKETHEPQTVKAGLEIDTTGDLILRINGIIIAYISSHSGKLRRCANAPYELNILRKIGISIDQDCRIETN